MRDPTRGGLATVAHEIARACGHNVALDQSAVPLRPEVVSVCEMLGYDPYYLACEGRIVAVADAPTAQEILARWQALPAGAAACIIGRVEAGDGRVILETSLGGRRILDELEDDPLPRIC
jgi:hydrogenase expression/formation protein HypE